MPKFSFKELLTKSKFNNRRMSTVDWLSRHINKRTGKPYLSYVNQCAAEKFIVLCERLMGQYRLSNWQSFVDKGHFEEKTPCTGNVRKILIKALKELGKDAELTTDILLKNYPLTEAEQKYNLKRGRAKQILCEALDKLAEVFELQIKTEKP